MEYKLEQDGSTIRVDTAVKQDYPVLDRLSYRQSLEAIIAQEQRMIANCQQRIAEVAKELADFDKHISDNNLELQPIELEPINEEEK